MCAAYMHTADGDCASPIRLNKIYNPRLYWTTCQRSSLLAPVRKGSGCFVLRRVARARKVRGLRATRRRRMHVTRLDGPRTPRAALDPTLPPSRLTRPIYFGGLTYYILSTLLYLWINQTSTREHRLVSLTNTFEHAFKCVS